MVPKFIAYDTKLKIMLYSQLDELGRLVLRPDFIEDRKTIECSWDNKDIKIMQCFSDEAEEVFINKNQIQEIINEYLVEPERIDYEYSRANCLDEIIEKFNFKLD